MSKTINCCCQNGKCKNSANLLQEFSVARNNCAALKKILVPDSVWPGFKEIAKESPDTVGHKYKILGAFQHGVLSKITYPIHRYLMDQNQPLEALKKSYKKALIEDWMSKKTPFIKHQKARIHEGKLNELLCAAWLENQGWQIDNLEALGSEFDIEATSTKNQPWAIEVKYTGEENRKFKEFEKCCISKDAVGGSFSIYDGYNFFLLKAYDASYQLLKKCTTKNKLTIIVFSHKTWDFNEMFIRDRWIDKFPIRFSDNASRNWLYFLSKKKKEAKYQNIDINLEEHITTLNELWVMRQHGNLEYSLEESYKF